jgi:hypothetical protein
MYLTFIFLSNVFYLCSVPGKSLPLIDGVTSSCTFYPQESVSGNMKTCTLIRAHIK